MIYFYVSLSTYICFCIIKYRESLHYLQKDKYDTKKYGNRISKDFKNIFITPELLSLVLIIVSLNFNIKVLGICTIIIYMLLFLYKLKNKNKDLKIDKKIKLRIVITLLIYVILNIWFCIDYKLRHGAGIIFDNTALYYIILIIVTYLSYIVIYIVNLIGKPVDKFLK